MTKKQAKIEALRICTAIVNKGVDLDEGYTQKEAEKVQSEIDAIGNTLYKLAVKLGGEFNMFTGYENGKKISI